MSEGSQFKHVSDEAWKRWVDGEEDFPGARRQLEREMRNDGLALRTAIYDIVSIIGSAMGRRR